MSKQDIELTAYCGLYCGDCIRFKSRICDLSIDLLKELDGSDFEKYAKVVSSSSRNASRRKRFTKYQEFHELLEEIASQQCIDPCRVRGGCSTFKCEIVECCSNKNFTGCWDCLEFENCDKFDFLKSMHGDNVLRNIREIKKFGLDEWADHRSKFYIWE